MRLNRVCALKMLLLGEHTGADSRARFLTEAETIAKVRHPNVVQIYGLGDHNSMHYFEMEYIEGGSLAHRLDGTPWAPCPAARMIGVLARAIGDAHRLGIVHRDLKPANVLLVDADTPKIVDFGLAKTLEADSHLTQSGVFVGTPSYAAPEQVEGLTGTIGPGDTTSTRSGAIFYHMLTGRPPFQAATVLQTLEEVKTADPVPPSRLLPGLSRDAETICLKCLEKDPQRRYADAAALAEDLDRYLAGRPILARPIGAVERLRKWSQRQPAEALLSAAMVAVTVLGFILVSWQWPHLKPRPSRKPPPTRGRCRLVAFEKQARLTFHQALALCDQARWGAAFVAGPSLELARGSQSKNLDRPIRINLADWSNQLGRPRRLPPIRHAGRSRTLLPIRGPCGPTRRSRQSLTPMAEVITVRRVGRLHVWDAETQSGFDLPPQGTEVTSSGGLAGWSSLRLGTEGGVIRLWDILAPGTIGQTCKLAVPSAAAPEFDPDSRVLNDQGTTAPFDPRRCPAGRPLGFPLRVNDPVQTVAFGKDGRRLLIGTTEGPRRWDLTGRPVCKSHQGRHDCLNDPPPGRIEATAVSPDGRTLATALSETAEGRSRGRVELRDATKLKSLRRTPDQPHALSGVVYSPDSRRLRTWGPGPRTAGLWDPLFRSLESPIRQAVFQPRRPEPPARLPGR